jgi:hypothetical protein
LALAAALSPKREGSYIFKSRGRVWEKAIYCVPKILDKDSSRIILDYIQKNNPKMDEIKNLIAIDQ